jgi:hypothetical protein
MSFKDISSHNIHKASIYCLTHVRKSKVFNIILSLNDISSDVAGKCKTPHSGELLFGMF